MCHPKALPGSYPKLLKDLKLKEKHNSLSHGRASQVAKTPESVGAVKALRWGYILGKIKPL